MQPRIFDYYAVYRHAIDQCVAGGEYHEAVHLTHRLVGIYPSLATAHALLAELLLKTGAIAEASKVAARAHFLDPNHEEVALVRAKILEAEGADVTLIPEIITQVTRYSTWFGLRRKYAQLLDKKGLYNESRGHWEEIARVTNLYEDRTHLAVCLAHLGEREQAVVIADSLLKNIPPTIAALKTIGNLLFALGEFPLFMQLLGNVVGSRLCDEDLIAEWANLFEKSGRHDAALSIIQTGMPFATTGLLREKMRKLEAELNIPKTKKHQWRSIRERRIIFVSEHPKIREAKLAYGLRRLGWEIILLHSKPLNADPDRYFDACYSFSSPQEVLDFIHSNDCRLIHLFCATVDQTALALLREKPGVIIYDTIDVFDGMLYFCHEAMPAQRYCIEHSDALVARDLQIPYSCKFSRTRRPRDVLFFPEYCWDFPAKDDHNSIAKASNSIHDDEVHLVQAGWINVQANHTTHQTYFDILSRFANAGIHVHLYAHMMFQKEDFAREYGDFIELGNKTGRAHLHDTVPFDCMPEELQRYSIGLSILPQVDLPGHSSRYPKNYAHFASCGSARNTDYLDAGLPILSGSILNFQNFILRRYGVPITFDERCLKDPYRYLRSLCTPQMKLQVLAKREPYTVVKQSHRLSAFYEHLQQKFRMRL